MVTYFGTCNGLSFTRTCVNRRQYTHAVVLIVTRQLARDPNNPTMALRDTHGALVYRECEPFIETVAFCGSKALAQKRAKAGGQIVAVQTRP